MKFITVTLNPALDMNITLPEALVPDGLNRASHAAFSPGGKGINVSRALHAGGIPSDAICVLGGFTGSKIKKMLDAEGVTVRPIVTTAETRVNVSAMYTATTGEVAQCEINNPPQRTVPGDGFTVRPPEETTEILGKLRVMLSRLVKMHRAEGERTTVILAGSIPSDMPQNTYAELIHYLSTMDVITVCDCDGEALRHSLSAYPTFIKPNLAELSALVGRHLTKDSIPGAAREICITTGGRTAVIATAGGSGAYFCRGREAYFAPAGHVERVRTLKGAGDTFLAAFLAGVYVRGLSEEAALTAAARAAAKKIATAGGAYPAL